jgi:CRP-like cAMP-binding protein
MVAAGKHVARAVRWTSAKSLQLGTNAVNALARLRPARPVRVAANAERSFYTCLPDRLATLAGLSPEQHDLVRNSLPERQIHQSGSTLLAEGEPMPRPTLILSGWACRTRVHDGRLHVLGILVPGDGINLFGPPGMVSSTSVCAMTTVETVNAQPVIDLVEQSEDDSALRLSTHRMMAEEEAFLLNQALRATMRSPVARLAHLLAELQFRLARTGLASATDMPFPLDRRTVAAALGLSPSVVGRAGRILETRRIARFGHNRVLIQREAELRKIAGFTPPVFSDGVRRHLINDVPEHEIVMPAPWMDAGTHTFELERRPA